jgi:hypothetical protein
MSEIFQAMTLAASGAPDRRARAAEILIYHKYKAVIGFGRAMQIVVACAHSDNNGLGNLKKKLGAIVKSTSGLFDATLLIKDIFGRVLFLIN